MRRRRTNTRTKSKKGGERDRGEEGKKIFSSHPTPHSTPTPPNKLHNILPIRSDDVYLQPDHRTPVTPRLSPPKPTRAYIQ